MKLICKEEALDPKGQKIMEFTKGNTYSFKKSFDLPGWESEDDNGNKEVFFDVHWMFEPIKQKL